MLIALTTRLHNDNLAIGHVKPLMSATALLQLHTTTPQCVEHTTVVATQHPAPHRTAPHRIAQHKASVQGSPHLCDLSAKAPKATPHASTVHTCVTYVQGP